MNVLPVYDIEGELEPAIEKLLNTKLADVLSSQDPQLFQKARPRVEIMAVLGTGKDFHLAPTEITGLPFEVEDAWTVTTHVSLVTVANADAHRLARAYVRYFFAALPDMINNVAGGIVNHTAFGPVLHLSTSPTFKGDFYKTEFSFSFTVTIHHDAWANLAP